MILGLLLWFSASFGMQDYVEAYESIPKVHPPIFAEIELHAENDYLDIYTIYRNEMKYYDNLSFMPLNDYFTVGASFTYEHVSFTYEHMCQHPVGNWGNPLVGEYGGYNTVFITVTSKP